MQPRGRAPAPVAAGDLPAHRLVGQLAHAIKLLLHRGPAASLAQELGKDGAARSPPQGYMAPARSLRGDGGGTAVPPGAVWPARSSLPRAPPPTPPRAAPPPAASPSRAPRNAWDRAMPGAALGTGPLRPGCLPPVSVRRGDPSTTESQGFTSCRGSSCGKKEQNRFSQCSLHVHVGEHWSQGEDLGHFGFSGTTATLDKCFLTGLLFSQAWADAFRSSPDLTGVVHIYEELKRKGVEFPMADLDALSPIHTPQRSVPEVDPAATMPRSQSQQRTSAGSYSSPPPAPYSAPQAPALSVTGPITANSEQIARLRSELDVVRGNTKVMSEMLTEMVPGQEDSSDLELLQELNRTCRAMQQRIVELISRVSNEEVTEELLHVNDDLNNVFLRYERFERYRSGRSVQNASNGVLNEVTEDNLIDLGPGSPAVVSPMVGNTAPPSSLSSQLAGLDLGTESVSGTLSSLQQCNPRDSFDMFAQTRGNSLAEQRKTVTYEDPQAVGGLASALDSRKQSSEGVGL
ncbi:TOM1-like protein 2 [Rhinopithecus roxellana]|uniref:TOM1-like protein 2 n=1 Tax=Rhinopithecus roxellana TaxID=61622 RepID=UPI001237833F|nr:TOM1-like protein 2 [Rhinopithecus roxellana]